ncbi:MAG: AAA family ATPase [Ignavibacteriae bacterium]|nr:AAA family ATPase [Ignavibacteriota bacterium]
MKTYKRLLNIRLPREQSAFLWGARKTGKTVYLKQFFPESIYYDLLKTDEYISFINKPYLLREQLLAVEKGKLNHPVIIDEIQKVPQLLDEVHWLIENKGIRFILCGSSARKLKRGKANFLGGRAWRFEMFPFVTEELDNFNLLRGLNHGFIPSHYIQDNYKKTIKAYIEDYLKQEVFEEGLTRNIPAFSRFFDSMAYSHGELINYSNIARECGVDSKTVREYYQILSDTLIGTMLEPFKRRQERQVINKAPKFYLFDAGVAGAIVHREIKEERGEQFGKAFEHFILMELLAHRSYRESDYQINFWRTKSGLEVDFILNGGQVAIEVKGTSLVDNSDLKAIKKFREEYKPEKAFVVCNESIPRVSDNIEIFPWRIFLRKLWDGDVI